MKANKTNPGQFTSWHMERAGDNRYSKGDQTKKPAAGERSKTLVTDGRPAGTHYRANPWHDGGPGARGARADELSKYSGTAFEKKSPNDAPFMKGDRARNAATGRLRSVRSDELAANNPTLKARAPEVLAQFPGATVGQLEAAYGASLSQIASMTQAQRKEALRAAKRAEQA